MRIAAIDIGTNSVRCTIVEVPVGGARKTLDDEKAYTRLGRGASASGQLSEEAMAETIDALGRMLRIAEQHEVTHIRAVATAAVRDARNGEEFVTRIRAETGLDVEVISEQEEGRLAFLSAADGAGLEGRSGVVDIGGGSVEIVRATHRQIEFITSMPIGAIVMSERYHCTDPMPPEDYVRLGKHVRRALKRTLAEDRAPVGVLVGSGGTVTTIGALIAARRDPGIANLYGYKMRRAEIKHLRAELATSTAEQRVSMKGMPPNRVDIIVAGVVVLDEAMRALGANEIVVNTRGIREGIVIDTIEREHGVSRGFDRTQAVREFARRCHADAAHAEQVCRLSLQFFDAMADSFGLPEEDRALLETAALLHDVGYHIAYERHHRHSYHLIAYAELPGFSTSETRMIASIARYHRGALPSAKHEAMQGLARPERQRVARLAALLKIADGLDRSRGQKVTAIDVQRTPARVFVSVSGSVPLDIEVLGAQRKADLFESVFNVRVDIIEASATPV